MTLNESNPGGRPASAERDPGLDRLYRAAGREEPPAHLDAAILAAAHREAGARPQALRRAALRRWHVPVSIAAVIVLSVSLVTLVGEEGGEQLTQAPPPAPAQPPVAQPAPPASALSESTQPRPPTTTPAQPQPPVARATPPAPALSERTQPHPSAAVPGVGSPAPREDARAEGALSGLGSMKDSITGETAGPAASKAAGAASAPDDAARSRPEPFRDAPSAVERRAAEPQAVPAEEFAARAPAAAERSGAPKVAAPAAKPLSRPRAMAQARKEEASVGAPTPVWHGFEKEPPQRWLERISELKRLERVADAEAMLAEFKRRFPDHPLPPGLP